MNIPKNPWQTRSTEVIFQNPWIKLIKDEVTTPTGKPGTYTILEAKPFIIVAALQDNAFLMIEQYRYPINKPTIEFPAGGLEVGEEPLAAAQRELKEETGYEAGRWEDAGEIHEIVSISRQPGHLFIARDLRRTGDHQMAEDGIEKARLIKINDIKTMIKNGAIFDALTPAVLCRVLLHLGLL